MKIVAINQNESEVAKAIWHIMQLSYAQEATLIDATDFPPLGRTSLSIESDLGIYFGAFINNILSGVLHIEKLHINSLVVHPEFQRQGVARKLIVNLSKLYKGKLVTVSTAQKNVPATSLYTRCGFILVKTHLKSGITLVDFERQF